MASIKCPVCNLTNWATSNSCKRCDFSFQEMTGQTYQPSSEFVPYNNSTAVVANSSTTQINTQPSYHRQVYSQNAPNINHYYNPDNRNIVAKPFWVELGMLGIKRRRSAVDWLNASLVASFLVALGTVFTLVKIMEMPFILSLVAGIILGIMCLSSSFWYWSCIKWMDENKGWEE